MTSDSSMKVASFRDVYDFRKSLSEESDRGSALLAGSYLDEQLKLLLLNKFVQDENIADKIVSQNGPLGAFSARIDTAYLLGLISKSTFKDLHLIRKIRNDFGHSPRPIAFTDSPISDRCGCFYHITRKDTASPRAKFCNATLGVLAMIHATMHKTAPFPLMPDHPITNELIDSTAEFADEMSKMTEHDALIAMDEFERSIINRLKTNPSK